MNKKASGYSLSAADIPTILGMNAREDRDHDIAAWFGVNQGRIAEAKEGKWGNPTPAPQNILPPKGPPGIKGRRLRERIGIIRTMLAAQNVNTKAVLEAANAAIAEYDDNEA